MDENNGAQADPAENSSQVPSAQENGASQADPAPDSTAPSNAPDGDAQGSSAFGGLADLIAEEEEKLDTRPTEPPTPSEGRVDSEPATRELEPDTPQLDPPTRVKEPETRDSAVDPAQPAAPAGGDEGPVRDRTTDVIPKPARGESPANAVPRRDSRSGTAIIERPPEEEAQADGQAAEETSEMPPARKFPEAPPWRDIGPPRLAKDIAAELSWPPPPSRKKVPVLILALTGVILVLLIAAVLALLIVLRKQKPTRDFSDLLGRGFSEIKYDDPATAKKYFNDAQKIMPQRAAEIAAMIQLADELDKFNEQVKDKNFDDARASLVRAIQLMKQVRPGWSKEYLKPYRDKIPESGAGPLPAPGPAPGPAPAPEAPAPAAP